MWNIRQVQLKSILLNDSSVTNNFPFRRQMTEFWEGLFAAVAHTPVQKSKQDLDLAMIRLRQLNRQSTLRTHEIKQLVSVDRERLDELNLEWQNLDYERRHLEKELDCYLNSKTVYQTIPLHSLEEYLCLTGGNSSMEVEDSAEAEDDHELMMKRLNFELIERKRLVSILEQETATRNTLLAQIQAKKNEIASIDRMLIELGEQSHAMFPQRESVLKEKLTGNYQ